eukprot:GHVS01077675.1.p1 GENE.GHVS01077675.1~~GHVS01077675.1.p1  ORF type:complete len:366 (+),score=70.51 GHVS01077675.1:286-1383(+)
MDLDGTLIQTKTGKTFPKDKFDWKFWGNEVKTLASVRNKCNEEGHRLLILTNQKGISQMKVPLTDITDKIDAIQKKLAVPMVAMVLTGDDCYRKPCIGAWEFFLNHLSTDKAVDLPSSLFVGDAAGRPAGDGRKKKDFSAGDLKFALNVGLPFATPERFFFGKSDHAVPSSFPFDPRALGTTSSSASSSPPPPPLSTAASDIQEVVLLCGPPGSGKSTLATTIFESYTWINQDMLRSKESCIVTYQKALSAGKSVVVDNQNRDAKVRAPYLEIAKKHGCKTRAVHLDVSKELCFHLNAYRLINPRTQLHRAKRVPDMVIHSFFKNIAPPQASEGFAEVSTITTANFTPGPFESDEDKRLFHSFLL